MIFGIATAQIGKFLGIAAIVFGLPIVFFIADSFIINLLGGRPNQINEIESVDTFDDTSEDY